MRTAPSRARLALAALLLVAGCGGGGKRGDGPYYGATILKQSDLSPAEFKALDQELPKRLGKTALLREDARGQTSPVELGKLSAGAKIALYLALRSGEDGWAEIDVRIRLADDRRVPVSIRRGAKHTLIVREGDVGERLARGHGENLQARYGIGPLREAGVAWSPRAKEVLDLALDAVDERERKVIAGVPFIRQPRGEDPAHGAIYHQDGCKAEIFFYDGALKADADQFVGEPESPLPTSVRTLLHEIGHALHERPGRLLACDLERRQKAFNDRIADLNRRAAAFNRDQRKMAAKAAKAAYADLQADQKALKKERDDLEDLADDLEADMKKGPVIAAYLKALGKASPPTAYAETSGRESFAESYSLYRTDPAALKRLLPKVYAFFEAGGHLPAR